MDNTERFEKAVRVLTVAPLLAATALLLFCTGASAAIKIGTDGNDTVVGTKNADHITGKGGNDTLEGRAGNDVYHFADGFGIDTLIEPKKVGKLPGGTDTVSFAGVTGQSSIKLIPQWIGEGYNIAYTSNGHILPGTFVVEKAVGGRSADIIYTGSAKNTLKGGAGGTDELRDYGGWSGTVDRPALPASDDTYKGFAAGPGFDTIIDHGGTADVLDLRPWDSSDVYIDAFDADGSGQDDSLTISAGDRGLYVYGHFAPLSTLRQDENGTMEKIVFADETITGTSGVKALVSASAGDGAKTVAPSEAPLLLTQEEPPKQ